MIALTPKAVEMVLGIIPQQENLDQIKGLRISVVGGGCSGFSYSMVFERSRVGPLPLDKIFEFEGKAPDGSQQKLRVFVDQASLLYLDGLNLDYVETLEGAGFKFDNPNAKSTCGCGSSFQG